jgi:hypothetical protein
MLSTQRVSSGSPRFWYLTPSIADHSIADCAPDGYPPGVRIADFKQAAERPPRGARLREALVAAVVAAFVLFLVAPDVAHAQSSKSAIRNPQSAISSFFPFTAPEHAITSPALVSVAEADKKMLPNEPVIGVSLGAESRAYSVWQLERVLVVNDIIAGRPVAVTWCPFSHTAVVYSRAVSGKTLTFEGDGRVLDDTIVLRDRETGTAWTQQDGRAIEGAQTGARLQQISALLTNWKEWKAEQAGSETVPPPANDAAAPPAPLTGASQGVRKTVAAPSSSVSVQVLDKGTVEIRSSLYADYDADRSAIGLGHIVMKEPRMSGKALVVGIVSGNDRLAVPLTRIKQDLVVNVVVDQQAMIILYDPDSDTVRVVRGEARGHKVSLRRGPATDLYGRPTPPHLLDEETTSRWDLTGKSFQGRMVDQRLLLIPYRCEYWYAWQAYFPKSRVE